MQLKKYIEISPHALRAFTFYASCLVLLAELLEKFLVWT